MLTRVSAPPERSSPTLAVPASTYVRAFKRALDLIVASVLLFALSPILVFTAVGIRVALGRGPIVLRQRRIGRGGEVFHLYKFRTMTADRRVAQVPFDGPDRRQHHKSDDDPRHRPFGRMLRRCSIDELPQLVNVINGSMSLVGPRPELADVASANGLAGHPRHLVRPGLTGPYQVSDLRIAGDLRDGLSLDLAYIRKLSLRRDLVLLLRTAVALVKRTGR